jgi:hypothetical protein
MTITAKNLIDVMRVQGKRFDGVEFISGRRDGTMPSYLPPLTQASFEIPESSLGASPATGVPAPDIWNAAWFEFISNQAHQGFLYRLGLADVDPTAEWPSITVSEFLAALADATLRVDSLGDAPVRQQLRAGLQISRVRIIGDDSAADGANQVLRLTNIKLPFSLRLIACVIETPIALSNAQLVTLDLSGSALLGIDASFITAAGSIRLRRSLISAPADFAGAQVRGYFDASDAILKPFAPMPASQSFDGDRGVLNLSQATIDNEVTLARTTIWGGLSMRGLHTKRSLLLDEATVLAPMAVLEAMARHVAPASLSVLVPGLAKPDFPCRPYHSQRYARGRCTAAVTARDLGLESFSARTRKDWRATALNKLITDTMRTRTTAIRADGLNIGGSLFAHALTADGRVRLKYSIVAGGMSMQGAQLRSIEAVRRTFDDMERFRNGSTSSRQLTPKLRLICRYRLKTYSDLVPPALRNRDELAPGADDYALDMREARFGGTVRIGTNEHGKHTSIDGRVGGDRGHFDGELLCQGVDFRWTFRIRIPGRYRTMMPRYRLRYRRLFHLAHRSHERDVRRGTLHAFDLRNAFVKDNVAFEVCTGLAGLNLTSAQIGGDVVFCDEIKPAPDAIQLPRAARRLTGRYTLIGVEIGGDCRLLFEKQNGPSIDANYSAIKGRLSILPIPPDGRDTTSLLFGDYLDLSEKSNTAYAEWEWAAFNGLSDWQARILRTATESAGIDLTNARAGLFCHPPGAWPDTGRLVVTGFAYGRGDVLGPLAPHPFAAGSPSFGTHEHEYTKQRAFWRRFYQLVMVGSIATMLGCAWHLRVNEALFDRTATFILLLFGALGFAASVYKWLRVKFPPWAEQSTPMALQWLRLQRLELNRYRTEERLGSMLGAKWVFMFGATTAVHRRGNIYHALEPYAVAVKALREEGRWLSANEVERRRLEVRAAQLSWRLHPFVKSFYGAVNLGTGFGFSPVRLVFINAFVVLVAASVANFAVRDGVLAHKDDTPAVACQSTKVTRVGASMTVRTTGCAKSADKAEFGAIAYALDVVIPAFALDENKNWEFQTVKRPTFLGFDAKNYMTIFHVIGLLLFSILIAAITARLSSVVNRFTD